MIRKGKKSDADKLANIHLSEFGSYFLPSLGGRFLHLLYISLLQNKDTYVWVEYSGKQVRGFVIGSRDFNSVFKRIISENLFKFIVIILPRILKNPTLLKNIFETFFYPNKEGSNTPKAELIIISVLNRYRRRGFGKKLVFSLEKNFIVQKVKKYKVSMNAKNLEAKAFYLSLGFKKTSEFYLYGERVNLLVKEIK